MTVIVRTLPSDIRANYVLGYGCAGAIAIYSLSLVHRFIIPQLRRMPLYAAVGVTTLLYMGAIVLSSALGIGIMVGLATGSRAQVEQLLTRFFAQGWEKTLGIPLAIALGMLFLVELTRRLGPGRLAGLLLGRYRNPREVTRIFLLIDLRGSTSLAEDLGSVQYSFLLRDFFDELTDPVLDTNGEVYEYVGDEAVICWPFRDGKNCDAALQCFRAFKKRIDSRSDQFMKTYGVVPQFKGAIHAGPVVATEVGQIKTQMVFHGDAINTASRVLGECNALGAELLVTENVAKYLTPTDGITLENLEKVRLRGKGDPLGLTRASLERENALRPSGDR